MRNGFIFDLNKCVGCQACVVACQIENGHQQSIPWREISTFNPFQHPKLPVFHFSLACNHCDDAPCMNSCPALAYKKNQSLFTIAHQPDDCIGCKYCTWACPYDAPKFVHSTGVIEKCTMCGHRLEEGKKPACANLCPTGALDYGDIISRDQSRIMGFTEKGIGPGIEIIKLRREKAPQSIAHLEPEGEKVFVSVNQPPPSKIDMNHEWVLVLFTLIVPVLTAFMSTYALDIKSPSPFIFMGIGIAGLLLSSVHLGKKLKAWRAILNIRNSWLSREILSYGLFLGTAFFGFIFPELSLLFYLSAIFGFTTTWFVDKIYLVTEKTTLLDMHSSSVFLSAMLFASLLSGNTIFAMLILGIKALLYIYRKIYFVLHRRKPNFILSMFRLLIGFVSPLFSWYSYPEIIFLFILLGELIDRTEFYTEANIISPKGQIVRDMVEKLKRA